MEFKVEDIVYIDTTMASGWNSNVDGCHFKIVDIKNDRFSLLVLGYHNLNNHRFELNRVITHDGAMYLKYYIEDFDIGL